MLRPALRCFVGICLLSGAAGLNATVISSGTITIPGTWDFDFDAGVIPSTISPDSDVFWDQISSTARALDPENGATIANIGAVTFNLVTLAELEALSYSTTGIDGSDATNVLVPGDVFAVHTNAGNYAKALVTGPFVAGADNGLPIQWETDSVPEPGTLSLVGLAALVIFVVAPALVRAAARLVLPRSQP